MVERRWLNYRKFVKYEKKWGKAWRICCMFLPMRPSNYVIFCNYVTRSLGSCVRSKELIRLAKIKNATERIYRRSLTRIYDLPVKISTALWHSFVLSHSPSSLSSLTPFFSSLFFLTPAFTPPSSRFCFFGFMSLFLHFFFFHKSNDYLEQRSATSVLLLCCSVLVLSALTDLTASSRNSVKGSVSLSGLPRGGYAFAPGNKIFRRWLRTMCPRIFLLLLLVYLSTTTCELFARATPSLVPRSWKTRISFKIELVNIHKCYFDILFFGNKRTNKMEHIYNSITFEEAWRASSEKFLADRKTEYVSTCKILRCIRCISDQ